MCPQLANPSPGGQEICAKLNTTKQPEPETDDLSKSKQCFVLLCDNEVKSGYS